METKGFLRLPRQGYGLFAANIWFKSQRYGRRELAAKVLSGMFDVSTYVELQRLPELFCGFVRRPGKGPALCPVACSPQAWAAGAVFMLLQASLGLRVHARTIVTRAVPTGAG